LKINKPELKEALDLFFVSEYRLTKTKEGHIYCENGTFSYQFWSRYLSVFENVYIVCRLFNKDLLITDENLLVEGNHVKVLPITGYKGPYEFLLNYFKIKSELQRYIKPYYAYICRVPGTLGSLTCFILENKGIKYGLEVVGDPADVFASGSVKHFLRPILRVVFTWNLKRIVSNASSVLYVTKNQLQKKYPCRKAIFQTNASNVVLGKEAFSNTPKTRAESSCIKLISIGSLEQMYKSPDVLLKAIRLLIDDGINCELKWLGDGKYRNSMIKLRNKLCLQNNVQFVGKVKPGKEIRYYLDKADIFILASRTEGLPRALLEAMASGLPCIGTNVGGIPELLDEQVIVPKDNPYELYNKLKYLIQNQEFTKAQAERNLVEAKLYSNEILDNRRNKFYRSLLEEKII
jgi:glycosyltransferase involved in cell wall biosynthesis